MKRRQFLFLATATGALPIFAHAQTSKPLIEIWRSPTCGCCGAWIKHLQQNGFATKVNMVDDTSAARKVAGIPERLGSCHTGKVGGYAVEGHVPAADIHRLLASRPQAVGLAVPGMPIGSPGMEQGDVKERYEVLLVKQGGATEVFARYG
jgi:hypothetical protein